MRWAPYRDYRILTQTDQLIWLPQVSGQRDPGQAQSSDIPCRRVAAYGT